MTLRGVPASPSLVRGVSCRRRRLPRRRPSEQGRNLKKGPVSVLGRFEAQRGGSHEPGLTVRVTQGLLRICLGCCGYEMVFAFLPVSPQSPDFLRQTGHRPAFLHEGYPLSGFSFWHFGGFLLLNSQLPSDRLEVLGPCFSFH